MTTDIASIPEQFPSLFLHLFPPSPPPLSFFPSPLLSSFPFYFPQPLKKGLSCRRRGGACFTRLMTSSGAKNLYIIKKVKYIQALQLGVGGGGVGGGGGGGGRWGGEGWGWCLEGNYSWSHPRHYKWEGNGMVLGGKFQVPPLLYETEHAYLPGIPLFMAAFMGGGIHLDVLQLVTVIVCS